MLSVLCTCYNEADFLDYSIRSYKDFVDNVVIVEGAYQETINIGKSPRSTDGTTDIIKKYIDNQRIFHIEANEQSDAQQRNVGLKKIKELSDDNSWLLIVDGDEIYDKSILGMIKVLCHTMGKTGKLAAYFKSLTFVNDFRHYTEQSFPRLFRVTKDCEFTSDNYMRWGEIDWFTPYVLKVPYIQYWHFAFCKGLERFYTKEKWWQTRFGKPFSYGWHVGKDGKITDDNHRVVPFTGKLPSIMESHPLYEK